MSKLGTALAFLAGAALGGVSAWYVAKTRYDELSEQEIDSAKQAFYAREQQLKEEIAALKEHLAKEDEPEEAPKTVLAANKNQEKGDINDYAKMVSRVGYSRTSVPPKPEHEVEAPYVISPKEVGEMDGYTQISLTYFDDGILSDENGVITSGVLDLYIDDCLRMPEKFRRGIDWGSIIGGVDKPRWNIDDFRPVPLEWPAWIDMVAGIQVIDGKDQLLEVRQALGL